MTDAPRDRLLAATVAHFAANGLGDLSLRSLAAALGTSHRMLLYHFGSKEALLAAVVAQVEAGQRDTLAALAASDDPPAVAALRFWRGLTDPAVRPHVRLFFELVALTLQGHPATAALRETLVAPWIDAVAAAELRRGRSPAEARARARLGVAAARGLLLDLLVTDDLEGVDAAMAAFVDAFA
ncbi:MAG: TetR/AcrR family transcriptional regulator [Myxococcota bacterium]